MTLIVGIKCSDGVVMGADGAASLGSLGQRTVQQPVRKLSIIDTKIIVGVSGPVGLGQRFIGEMETLWQDKKLSGKKPHEAMTIIREQLWQHAGREFEIAKHAAGLIGPQNAALSVVSATVVALPLSKAHCLIQFDQQCAPEEAKELPFVAVGSGQSLADPFLAFIKRLFWTAGPPTLSQGILAVVWTLTQATKINTGGISEPLQVATLQGQGSDTRARELAEDELSEHRQQVADLEKHIADYGKPALGVDLASPPTPT